MAERDEEARRRGDEGDEGGRASFLSGLLIGAVAGVALALLFAPAPGETTRRLLGDRVRRLRDRASAGIEDLREQAESRITGRRG